MANEVIPEVQVSSNRLASDLYKEKHQARQERQASVSAKAVKTAGTTAQVGGKAAQVGGAATEYGGKGVRAVGRGVESGGQAITRAGAGLSESGYGAIIGVPLAAVGGVITGLGAGMQTAGQGLESGGRSARQTGKQISHVGSRLKEQSDLADRRFFRSGKHQDRERNFSFAGAVVGATGVSDAAQDRIDRAVQVAATPIRLATDMALRSSWTSLIPSWGVTLLWINIHVFLRFVLGTSFFCKLGHEWASGGRALAGGGGMEAKAGAEVFKKVEGGTGVVEALGLALLDLLVLFIILLIISVFAWVVGIVTYPLEFIGQTLEAVGEALGL